MPPNALYARKALVKLRNAHTDRASGAVLPAGSRGTVQDSHGTGAGYRLFQYVVLFDDWGKFIGIPEKDLAPSE